MRRKGINMNQLTEPLLHLAECRSVFLGCESRAFSHCLFSQTLRGVNVFVQHLLLFPQGACFPLLDLIRCASQKCVMSPGAIELLSEAGHLRGQLLLL